MDEMERRIACTLLPSVFYTCIMANHHQFEFILKHFTRPFQVMARASKRRNYAVVISIFLLLLFIHYPWSEHTFYANSLEDYEEKEEICPLIPPGLVGEFEFKHYNGILKEIEEVFKKYNPMKGGRFSPIHCTAREKVAILIPFRDRWPHLLDMLHHLIPILIRQQIEFTIYVIEQDPPEKFNRGAIMNIGYLESLKEDNYTCIIIHDVDMYPIDDRNLYRCGVLPRHMAVALERDGYGLSYSNFYGGIVSYRTRHYELTNGFSNLFDGWGGEDDDQLLRLKYMKMNFVRYPSKYTKYATPRHKRDKTNPVNPNKQKLLRTSRDRIWYDGLNTIAYRVNKKKHRTIYTHINVSIDKKQILKNTELRKKGLAIKKKDIFVANLGNSEIVL